MSRAGSEASGHDPLFEQLRQNHLRDLERAGEDPYGIGTADPAPAPAPPGTFAGTTNTHPDAEPTHRDADEIVFDQDPQVRLTLNLPTSVWKRIAEGVSYHPIADIIAERVGFDSPATTQDEVS